MAENANSKDPEPRLDASILDRVWPEGESPDYEKATLSDLLKAKRPKNEWIVKNLIHAGDQVVLAGPPKIGKSILGTQLALAVAKGKQTSFLLDEFVTPSNPRRVLVFSLEMNAPMVAERMSQIFPRGAAKQKTNPADIPATFVFSAEGAASFDIINFYSSFESVVKKAAHPRLSEDGALLKEIIRLENPDLVIFDTLIRVHAVDENNNVAMSHLLRMLRRVCSTDERRPVNEGESMTVKRKRRHIAHVVIHHTRKESAVAHGWGNRDANAVRGAGAIHAEADLVLTMSEMNHKGLVMISMSARRIPVPGEVYVERKKLHFQGVPRPLGLRQTKAGKLADALWKALAERRRSDSMLTRAQLVQRVAQLGYGDLTEDNFRKSYYRKIAPFVISKMPRKKDADQSHRYRLLESADEDAFRKALGAAPKNKE